MAFVVRSKFPRAVRRYERASKALDSLGDKAIFFVKALGSVPRALVHYRTETIRLIAEISMGSGALAVIGGTVVIVGFLTLMAGGTIAVQGYSSLGNIGVEALTGFFAAFINVRIAAPVISGIGLAATIGAGATAQLGAMRVAEEIDALESMAIRPVPFLVGTRVLAGMIAIVPLYALAVIASFIASRFATVVIYGQSAGVYDHYFSTFLIPSDILWSFAQAMVMALAVMLIHTYYGFHAAGGPVGVGVAVGNAVRASLVAVVTVTLLISLAIYGTSGNFHLSG
ncbi:MULTISPECIES: MlaE family ABC transporter permease [Nocardia]|uniref:Phospholipid/cholesterol/gamma-HCH transport system permease protein n=2 Tax=Nocardia TaxID=1817 RepID=A0A4R6PMJ0_NOCIG|nr:MULTISPECIES: ABC transporter permease [Nocardia]KAF0847943.1 phospholipid/cholesterol/gamma-HCH transport system permease protein [Nocardia caishijiensis]MCA2209374.1 ABC transporter permease [Nocardia rosealba]TDP39470.1 phospholipid/cholesterol/gamma-HCH transport system permease protein [Nocardia ignorata]